MLSTFTFEFCDLEGLARLQGVRVDRGPPDTVPMNRQELQKGVKGAGDSWTSTPSSWPRATVKCLSLVG